MVFWHPIHDNLNPLSMIFWTPYSSYFWPPTHGIWTPYRLYFEPATHGILTPTHGIVTSLSMVFHSISFGHCAVCSSSIYGSWLPLWYLQTPLKNNSLCYKHYRDYVNIVVNCYKCLPNPLIGNSPYTTSDPLLKPLPENISNVSIAMTDTLKFVKSPCNYIPVDHNG